MIARMHERVDQHSKYGTEAETISQLKFFFEKQQENIKQKVPETTSKFAQEAGKEKRLSSEQLALSKQSAENYCQIGGIFSYWTKHMSLLSKSLNVLSQIDKLQREFSVITKRAEDIQLFKQIFQSESTSKNSKESSRNHAKSNNETSRSRNEENEQDNKQLDEEKEMQEQEQSSSQSLESIMSQSSSSVSSEENEEDEQGSQPKNYPELTVSPPQSINQDKDVLNQEEPLDLASGSSIPKLDSQQLSNERLKTSSPKKERVMNQSPTRSKQSTLKKWFSEKPLHLQPNNSRKSRLVLNFSELSRDHLVSSPLQLQQFQSNNMALSASPNQRGINFSPVVSSSSLDRKKLGQIDVKNSNNSNIASPNISISSLSNSLNPNMLSPDILVTSSPMKRPGAMGAQRHSVFFGRPFALDQQSLLSSSPLLKVNSSKRESQAPKLSSFNLNSLKLLPAQEKAEIQPKESNATSHIQNTEISNPEGESNAANASECVFQSFMQNELSIAKQLMRIIITDLYNLQENSLGNFCSIPEKYENSSESIQQSIASNSTPAQWWVHSFLSRQEDFSKFIGQLMSRLESLQMLLLERKCKIYPVIQLQRSFDPFSLLGLFLNKYAQQQHLSIVDLSLQCTVINQPISAQPTDGSINVSGLFLKRAKLNKDNILQLEDNRQFEFKLPNLQITVKKKIFINNFYTAYQPSIAMYFKDDSIFDFEGTFYNENQIVNGIRKPVQIKRNQGETNKTYLVRLPVINPLTTHIFNQFPLRIFFYMKSQRPQEFWVKRGAEIYLHQEFE